MPPLVRDSCATIHVGLWAHPTEAKEDMGHVERGGKTIQRGETQLYSTDFSPTDPNANHFSVCVSREHCMLPRFFSSARILSARPFHRACTPRGGHHNRHLILNDSPNLPEPTFDPDQVSAVRGTQYEQDALSYLVCQSNLPNEYLHRYIS